MNRLAVRADRLLAFLKSSVKGSDRSRNIPTDTGPRVKEHGVKERREKYWKEYGTAGVVGTPLLFTSSTPHTPRATRKRERARNGAQRAAPRCFNLPRLGTNSGSILMSLSTYTARKRRTSSPRATHEVFLYRSKTVSSSTSHHGPKQHIPDQIVARHRREQQPRHALSEYNWIQTSKEDVALPAKSGQFNVR